MKVRYLLVLIAGMAVFTAFSKEQSSRQLSISGRDVASKVMSGLLLSTEQVDEEEVFYDLNVTWKYINVVESADHASKMKVYVDGKYVGKSKNAFQSWGNSFTVKIPAGKHLISIVGEAMYNDVWEEHTKKNGYVLDAIYKKKMLVNKSVDVKLVIDLDNKKTINEWK